MPSYTINIHANSDDRPILETSVPSESIPVEYYLLRLGDLTLFLDRAHLAPLCAALAQAVATTPAVYDPSAAAGTKGE